MSSQSKFRLAFGVGSLIVLVALIIAIIWICRPSQKVIDRRVRFDICAFDGALRQFYIDCGRYPSEKEGLRVLMSGKDIIGWDGPYLKGQETNIILDQWGTPFKYYFNETEPIIVSAGPDRKFNTDDDVMSRIPNGAKSLL